jgi:hypothetical protein
MKKTKTKPLSMKLAAHTQIHINADFVTNGHFALRASLFDVLGIQNSSLETRAYSVNGRGTLDGGFDSPLNREKIERVFTMADDPAADYHAAYAVTPMETTLQISSLQGNCVYVALKYKTLYERLAAIPGGEWCINVESEMRALRFVLNGRTEALLMPVKPAAKRNKKDNEKNKN